MVKRSFPPQNEIIEVLKTYYGIDIDSFTFLASGADPNALTYKASTKNNAYFIKIKHGSTFNWEIMDLFWGSGVKQIIYSIKTTTGQSTYKVGNFTYLVYPFIEGQDGFNRPLTRHQWLLLGQALKQVHEVAIPPKFEKIIRREEYSNCWREKVRNVLSDIDTKKGKGITSQFLAFFKANQTTVQRLVERAEELAARIKRQPTEFVLCHSDIHGGNVFIDAKDSIYIIDWDEPIMAPKERDLMFIGGGVAHVWNKPEEVEWFYQGYGDVEINRNILAYYRHERIVEDIAVYSQELLDESIEEPTKQISFDRLTSMFTPKDVVEIAFKTDPDLQR